MSEPKALWRAGRPIEDPDKTKRWGFISARPSEYLVHLRRGRLLERSSGQGASCFKLPWDGVAIVPTTLQTVKFRADQVTLERVGVEVSGFLVYRIAEPLLASRVLSFSYPERAQQKLEETLTEMLVGATRRLVANLSVDRCLGERKSALADELLRELAPVVGGEGRAEDHTDRGWGVVIDTIEVQEVRVRSESVFQMLQAPFRAEIEEKARRAEAEAESSVATAAAELTRRADEAKIAAEATVAQRRAEAARASREATAQADLRAIELEREKTAAAARAAQVLEEERLASDLELTKRRVDAAREEAELRAEAERHARALWKDATELSLSLADLREAERVAEATAALARADHEVRLAERLIAEKLARGRADEELRRLSAENAQRESEAKARVIVAEKLPELAGAVGAKVSVTQLGAGQPVIELLRAVIALASDSAAPRVER